MPELPVRAQKNTSIDNSAFVSDESDVNSDEGFDISSLTNNIKDVSNQFNNVKPTVLKSVPSYIQCNNNQKAISRENSMNLINDKENTNPITIIVNNDSST
ncbi:uncharacterized protein [Prorops nasuta]|uniref:uncharacterized protein n=1 Tax=Prorops nasuta TaxID=863751 RepID=UPI0034CE6056